MNLIQFNTNLNWLAFSKKYSIVFILLASISFNIELLDNEVLTQRGFFIFDLKKKTGNFLCNFDDKNLKCKKDLNICSYVKITLFFCASNRIKGMILIELC